MKITQEEVQHVADLSRLSFSEQEMENITKQLNDILTYVAQLEEVETSDVEPMAHVFKIVNAFRQDQVKQSLPSDKALANAPERENNTFVVPRII